jgi:bifunctional NMN adenylyltransferase/nudix hydrolase
MFNGKVEGWGPALWNQVPEGTHAYLEQLRISKINEFVSLNREWAFIEKYKEQWKSAPYAPTFVTCDATVIQSGHVLLVKRRAEPGKGLWAVPGGFLNPGERIKDGIFRELKEETKIDVPEKVLRGSLRGIKVFDHPDRSLRGRTITHNALIVLPNGSLPKIKGSDDAEVAKWTPLGEVNSSNMFEDHYDMVQIQKDLVTG